MVPILSIFILVITTGISTVVGQCPIKYNKDERSSHCRQVETVFCCHSLGSKAECVIETPTDAKAISTVVIENCIITDLSQESMKSLSNTSLTHLQLINVRIDSIANNTFGQLAMLKNLKLVPAVKVNFSMLGNAIVSSSHVRSLSITHTAIESLAFDMLQNMHSLQSLDLSNNNIVDAIWSTPMGNLTVLKLRGNRLCELNYSSWQQLGNTLPNLEFLDLSVNSLTDLGDICWASFPNLRKLHLMGNHITYLNFSQLEILTNLTDLDLSDNWLSTKSYDAHINSLRRLSLRRNNFATFPPWLCNNGTAFFPNLEFLDLSHNLIRYAIPQAWACLTKLKELDLSVNSFKSLQNNVFADLISLEKLHIHSIKENLHTIEPAAFNISSLVYLDLMFCGIQFGLDPNLTCIFQYLENLKTLNLSYNILSGQNATGINNLLAPLKSIETLNLTGVHLYSLPTELLGNYPNLTYLILDRNKMESYDLPSSFNSSRNLAYLSLSQNFIRVITNSSFEGAIWNTLVEIDLSYNPLDCSCDNLWFRSYIEKSKAQTGHIRLNNWPSQYRCRTPVKLSNTLFEDYHPTESECAPLNPMLIAYITIGCFLFVFCVTTYTVYRFRWHITYWRYKMRRKTNRNKDNEMRPLLIKALKYDAYVIYRFEDQDLDKFIRKEFDPMVEQLGYNCFFWDRDAGCGPKVSEIGDGIYGSNNVIAIVTNNFLKDPWCKFQIEVALDRQVEVQRQILMFVVLEDVDFQLLNKFWCVRFTKSPTVRWCSNTNDIKRKLIEEEIRNILGDPGPKNRAALRV